MDICLEGGELRRGFPEEVAFTGDLEVGTEFEPSKNINNRYSFNTTEFANEHFHYLPSSDPQSLPER